MMNSRACKAGPSLLSLGLASQSIFPYRCKPFFIVRHTCYYSITRMNKNHTAIAMVNWYVPEEEVLKFQLAIHFTMAHFFYHTYILLDVQQHIESFALQRPNIHFASLFLIILGCRISKSAWICMDFPSLLRYKCCRHHELSNNHIFNSTWVIDKTCYFTVSSHCVST